jgi:hypothetical protein
MQMVQGWLAKPEERLRPGCVRIGWREDQLLVFAELEDEVLFTKATADNQYLWALGDVFEIFVQDHSGGRYAEFHIAPNGRRMQLIYPDAEANRRIGEPGVRLEDFMIGEFLFEFSIWQEPGKWLILASVPSSIFLPPGTSLADRIWRVSFSRYDYSSAETPPVLSSTSPHRVLSFHRQEEWTWVRFSTSGGSLVPIAGKC